MHRYSGLVSTVPESRLVNALSGVSETDVGGKGEAGANLDGRSTVLSSQPFTSMAARQRAAAKDRMMAICPLLSAARHGHLDSSGS